MILGIHYVRMLSYQIFRKLQEKKFDICDKRQIHPQYLYPVTSNDDYGPIWKFTELGVSPNVWSIQRNGQRFQP